ncbi:hypothetical protein HK097_003581 [Rhizophlyctis rosea]|uniref:C2H2-type domain-containing protein n=1 Tax=Rhizophlyctis rosea TaxID=64517 RepID=A0AAD5S478_9FUNG|nr:hypothetical protein HK097_003581 [Rhizophlyctis rosea]
MTVPLTWEGSHQAYIGTNLFAWIYARGLFRVEGWKNILESGDFRLNEFALEFPVLCLIDEDKTGFQDSAPWGSSGVNRLLKSAAAQAGFDPKRVSAKGHRTAMARVVNNVLGVEGSRHILAHSATSNAATKLEPIPLPYGGKASEEINRQTETRLSLTRLNADNIQRRVRRRSNKDYRQDDAYRSIDDEWQSIAKSLRQTRNPSQRDSDSESENTPVQLPVPEKQKLLARLEHLDKERSKRQKILREQFRVKESVTAHEQAAVVNNLPQNVAESTRYDMDRRPLSDLIEALERAKRKEQRNICLYCGTSFQSSSTLGSHVLTHTKPYTCSLCDMRFSRHSNLSAHITTQHSGSQPRSKKTKCSKGCGQLLSTPSAERKHAKKCTGTANHSRPGRKIFDEDVAIAGLPCRCSCGATFTKKYGEELHASRCKEGAKRPISDGDVIDLTNDKDGAGVSLDQGSEVRVVRRGGRAVIMEDEEEDDDDRDNDEDRDNDDEDRDDDEDEDDFYQRGIEEGLEGVDDQEYVDEEDMDEGGEVVDDGLGAGLDKGWVLPNGELNYASLRL